MSLVSLRSEDESSISANRFVDRFSAHKRFHSMDRTIDRRTGGLLKARRRNLMKTITSDARLSGTAFPHLSTGFLIYNGVAVRIWRQLGKDLDLLKPKRLTIAVLLPLILLVPSLLNATNAQNSENMRNAKALLDTVEVASAGVSETFDELEAAGILVPNDAAKLRREGLQRAEKASDLMTAGDYVGASSTAVEALQRFKGALQIVYKILPKTPDEAEVIAERIIGLKVAANRAYEYVKRLELLTARAQEAGHNCTSLKGLIDDAKAHLDNALRKLDGLSVVDASRELVSAKALLNRSLVLYGRLSSNVKLVKAEAFLAETETRFPVLRANVTAFSQRLPEEEKAATSAALSKASINLQNARVFIEKAKIEEAVEELVEYRERLKESLKYVQSVQAELEKNNLEETSSV